ncbi:hypothetical protein PN36_17505 [Candidatus Thiomargarita nelsonii]|uniref:Carrier domain-containing protein n=1 Tax=Candidatus Thiomargarita nelsonii TaxID=1003181 RepID=A0A4E0R1B9_9GAMM|nr:hypothetical protein PN36_17505 [Candidatus Thiomargarita nelsonii]
MDRQEILKIVLEAVSEVGEDEDKDILQNPDESTRLYGGANGNLDSMGVVFLVTELEESLSEKLGIDLTLADDRAMSQRNSPFKSVKTITDYIMMLLKEKQENS